MNEIIGLSRTIIFGREQVSIAARLGYVHAGNYWRAQVERCEARLLTIAIALEQIDVLKVLDTATWAANQGGFCEPGELEQARAAVAELIEAAGLRVDWCNGSWYVMLADLETAWSNTPHATKEGAELEAEQARRAALARVQGGAV